MKKLLEAICVQIKRREIGDVGFLSELFQRDPIMRCGYTLVWRIKGEFL